MNSRFACVVLLAHLLIMTACKPSADVVINKPSAPFGSVVDALFSDAYAYVLLREKDELQLVRLGESGIEQSTKARLGESLKLDSAEVVYLYDRGRPKPILRFANNQAVELDVARAAQRIPESISPDRRWFVVGLPGLDNTEAVLVDLQTGEERRLGVGGGKRVQWQDNSQFVVLDASLSSDPVGFAGFGHARPTLFEITKTSAGKMGWSKLEQQEMLGYQEVAVGWDGTSPLQRERFAILDPEGTDSTVMPGGLRIDGPGISSSRAIGTRLWFIGEGKLWAVPFDASVVDDVSILQTQSPIDDFVVSAESDEFSVCVMLEDGTILRYQLVGDNWRHVISDSVGSK